VIANPIESDVYIAGYVQNEKMSHFGMSADVEADSRVSGHLSVCVFRPIGVVRLSREWKTFGGNVLSFHEGFVDGGIGTARIKKRIWDKRSSIVGS
jgi:hypothetical protein